MDPKPELLVFNKKEILVIIVLLVLVALFSFTLGLKLGKKLGASVKITEVEHPPLASEEHTAIVDSEREESNHGSLAHEKAQASPARTDEAPADQPKRLAEDQADAAFTQETDKERVASGKAVPMAFPKEKKNGGAAVKFTLQLGAYRTVAEATEQVSVFKRRGLDAFYIEASVPGKGTWYRVGLGIFATKEQAEEAAVKWKSKNLPPYIIQKIGE